GGGAARRAQPERCGHPQHGQTIAPFERVLVHDAGNEMQRRREHRLAREPRLAALPIDHRDAERRLDAHVAGGADVAQEVERLLIAAEQDVLTVVDELAGLAIGKRRRAAAEPRPRLEHDNAGPGARQPDGRAQAGEPGADDYDVASHCLNAMNAWRGRGTRTRAVNTS